MKDSILFIIPAHPAGWKSLVGGVAYLAAVLEKAGIEVEVLDCQVEDNYNFKIIEALRRHSLVGISVNIATISNALQISKLVRENSPQAKIIMGGPHPTAIFDKLIPEYADIVVIGEGEETILELMKTKDLSEVKGIAYWQNNKVKLNPKREFITDLDKLPYPAWHLFKLSRYGPILKKSGSVFLPVFTSRGCPYRCIFCSKNNHGEKIRLRSAQNVVNEISYLVKEFKVKTIKISDENFTFYPERVKELCRAIIRKKIQDINFSLNVGIRADKGDLEMFKLLKQIGCYGTPIAIESGSQEVLDKIGKNLDLSKVRDIVLMAKKAKLLVGLNFILGFPFETKETMLKTIEFSKTLPVETAIFFMPVPLPGTELYGIVEKEGRYLYDVNMHSVTHKEGHAYFETEILKSDVVEKMCKKAFLEFYLRPIQIWRIFLGLINLSYIMRKEISLVGLLKYFKNKWDYLPMRI